MHFVCNAIIRYRIGHFKRCCLRQVPCHVSCLAARHNLGQTEEERCHVGAGRVAMVGFLGLVAVEVVLGRALFS